MFTPSERGDYEQLERGLLADECQALLLGLQKDERFMRQFDTWADVIAFMRRGTSRDPHKNEVLASILRRYGEDQDPRWLSVLLAVFWPGLLSIHRKKGFWDPDDPDELLQRIFCAFFESVRRVDLRRRGDSLVKRLYMSTLHRVYDQYERTWARASREVAVDRDELEEICGGAVLDLDEVIDLRAALDRKARQFREHRAAGRLTEPEFLLMLATRVYGAPLAAYAREVGLKVETLKKRRQRLEARLRRFEQAKRPSSDGVSPPGVVVPPLTCEGERRAARKGAQR